MIRLIMLVSSMLLLADYSHAQGCDPPNLNPDQLNSLPGQPFMDCGALSGTRTPNPTKSPHAFQTDRWRVCVTSDWSLASWMWGDGLNMTVSGSDTEVANQGAMPGDVTFTGSRIRWINQNGGTVAGEYIVAPGATDIEVDGVCITDTAVEPPATFPTPILLDAK